MTKSSNVIYLVTGAAGFLGGTICRQLIERGDRVRAFVLNNDPAEKYVPSQAEIVRGDLTDMESLERFFTVSEGMETIVMHIASIVTVNPDFNQKVIDVNVGGTEKIISLCKNHTECRKLVYCSSTGAIPEKPKGEKIAEIGRFDETKVRGCYSMSKAMATQAVLNAAASGLNACVVHPSGIMGPEDFAMGETTRGIVDIVKGKMPIGIAGSFNLCDVRDLAHGAILAADKGKSGECYILGNDEVTFPKFVQLICEEAKCKKVKFFLPIRFAYFMARIMEKQAKRKGTKPMLTTFSVYNLARNNNFDSSKAKRELGYTTRSYSETIHDEIEWLKTTGKI